MTRWAGAALVALGAYGVSLAAAGVALAAGPSADPDGVVNVIGAPQPSASSATTGATGEPEAAETPVRPESISSGLSAGSIAVPTARGGTVAPGQTVTFIPTRIVLPSGTTAPVTPSGVQADGSLVIPASPAVVGWWDGGAHAGDPMGSLVIAGHVDSRVYGLGVLAELKRVKVGAVIELRAGTQSLRYRVYQAVQVNQQSLAQDGEFFRQDGAPRLVVITCGGPFDQSKHRYRDNYIVLASPLAG